MGKIFVGSNFHGQFNPQNLTPLKFDTTKICDDSHMATECKNKLCVLGYHMYKNIWEAAFRETVSCVRKSRNARDRYAVAVEKNSTVIEHLPRKVSCVCALLLKQGGSI